ncbi:hypothetical protein [Ascidiimonas aurantiaca]|uniref:hypothetical protein n=1 Tax=Ascidiimonas aurantiaca TaxID=1685432 RepID=UPI0030EDAEC3
MQRTNKIIFFFILFIKITETVFGQDTKRIQGTVVSNGEDVSSIHVFNQTRHTFTITDENGFFSVVASVNDTLSFSAIQYLQEKVIVSEEIYQKGELEVIMRIKVNALDEVVVRPHSLSGDLLKDINQVDQDKIVTGVSLGLPNQYVRVKTQTERRIYEARTGGGIIPLNPIINAISGRTKKLKQQLKLERQAARLESVTTSFNTELYSEVFKIPAEHIDGFILFCASDPTFLNVHETGDLLLMMEYLKAKGQEYNQLQKG